MKKLFLILIYGFVFIGFSQSETKQEYFKNGNLKYERTYVNGEEVVIKKYYKSGGLSYQKINNNNETIEEAYSKDGLLIIRSVNGNIAFNMYEDDLKKLENDDAHNNRNHGHTHGHGHHHH